MRAHPLRAHHRLSLSKDPFHSCHVAAKGAAPALHDRKKASAVAPAASYLVALGVTSAEGKPRPGMAAKLRQIERFVQTIASLVGARAVVGVCDGACGRRGCKNPNAQMWEAYGGV